MTSPRDPNPETIDLTAMVAPANQAASAIQDSYWDSPEFAAAVEGTAQRTIDMSLTAINLSDSAIDKISFATDEDDLDNKGLFAPVEPNQDPQLFRYPLPLQAYHDKVRNGILGALAHTEAVPLELYDPLTPSTVRIAWNNDGKAFFIREKQASELEGWDPKELGPYTGGLEWLTRWHGPALSIDRELRNDNGNVTEKVLRALKGLEGDNNEAIRRTAAKVLDDMEKQRTAYYRSRGGLGVANTTEYETVDIAGKEWSVPKHLAFEDITAGRFDTEKLHEAEVKSRGLGRLASRLGRSR